MTNELDQAAGGGIGLAFLLSEMRDLRKGMETRDENLRGSIDSVRDSVNVLSAKVDRSQGDVDKMHNDMRIVREDLGAMRADVDEIMIARSTDKIIQESAWSGPAKVARNLAIIGGAIAGIVAIINFWPIIAPWLVATTLPTP